MAARRACGIAFAWLAAAALGAAGAEPAGGAAEAALEAEADLDVQTILANPLGAEDYRKSQRCIPSRSYRSIEVLDEANVLFVGRKRFWLNRLRGRCPGLRQDMTLYLNARGMRVCHLDHFRARQRGGVSALTPMCMLGGFEEIDETQMQGLRDSLAPSRRAPAPASPVADGGA